MREWGHDEIVFRRRYVARFANYSCRLVWKNIRCICIAIPVHSCTLVRKFSHTAVVLAAATRFSFRFVLSRRSFPRKQTIRVLFQFVRREDFATCNFCCRFGRRCLVAQRAKFRRRSINSWNPKVGDIQKYFGLSFDYSSDSVCAIPSLLLSFRSSRSN